MFSHRQKRTLSIVKLYPDSSERFRITDKQERENIMKKRLIIAFAIGILLLTVCGSLVTMRASSLRTGASLDPGSFWHA
jgi:hypothetical protein